MRGWQWIVALQILVAACHGIGAWAFAMTVAPLIAGDTFDGDYPVLMLFFFVGILAASVLETFLAVAPWWSAHFPLLADEGPTVGYAGAAIGVLIAAPVQRSLLAQLLAAAIFVLLVFLAVRSGRNTIHEQYDAVYEHARLMHLHAYGTRVRAEVLESTYTNTGPTFVVTLEYATPCGRKEVTTRVHTSAIGAPIAGGTMLLWFLADGADVDNIDIEEDPESIREPGAAERYQDQD